MQRKITSASLISEAKGRPCADCGWSYIEFIMEFDHPQKVRSDSSIKSLSVEKAKAEIAKYEVVCSNCRKTRIHNRILVPAKKVAEKAKPSALSHAEAIALQKEAEAAALGIAEEIARNLR